MHQQKPSEILLKVLVVGEASTGKTSFIKRYVHQFFSRAYKATIGVDFALKTLQYNNNTLVRLQLWDIAGQERFGSMTRAYYKGAQGAFLVFDVNSPKTFECILRWKDDLDTKVRLRDGTKVPCLLLANKCDLVKTTKHDEEVLQEFAKDNGFIGCVYTSPKDNINIDTAAQLLIQEIMRVDQFVDSRNQNRYVGGAIIVGEDYDRLTREGDSKKNCCG